MSDSDDPVDPAGPNQGRRGHRRRVMLLAGVAMLVGGLAIAGYLAWQLVGTDWVAHRRYDQQVTALREEWERGGETVDEGHGPVHGIVRIPRFGADYEVPLLEGTGEEALSSGIGHFTGTAAPGHEGNFAIGAHRVTHGEPFRDMPDLRVGDEVIIETADTIYTYVLDTPGSGLSVSYDQTWVLDAIPANPRARGIEPAQRPGQKLLTLLTCAELFHTDQRLVAFGHLRDEAPTNQAQ